MKNLNDSQGPKDKPTAFFTVFFGTKASLADDDAFDVINNCW